jgi:23S rRNA (cytosine1962-C5)-methyltransferase
MPELVLLAAPPWAEYELLDTGNGAKLERFGSYVLVRPETQAIWQPALPEREWLRADAVFEKQRGGVGDDSAGQWNVRREVPAQWLLHHHNLAFWLRLSPFRHTGIFPEHSAHWAWLKHWVESIERPRALVLFGYTGATTLFLAQCGAEVVHVDASKPAVRWAQENQRASHLDQHPVRWLVDDVSKFVAREIRRNHRYDIILLDPPVFGRGPKGEIWRIQEQLPALLQQCVQLLSDRAQGMVVNAYATTMSALTLQHVLDDALRGRTGIREAGELVLQQQRTQRFLPAALFACWSRECSLRQVVGNEIGRVTG